MVELIVHLLHLYLANMPRKILFISQMVERMRWDREGPSRVEEGSDGG